MRYSRFLIPTLKEDPAEAEVVSHRLMLRAGMIKKLAAGIYSMLPIGERVMQKMTQVIREEMNRAGALELTLPFVQPAELWQESGRWDVYGKELLRIQDRHNREFCLGPTHEEVITDLVRSVVSSYKQLPVNLYQIHIKFRDEIRPRYGVMRAREFVMKDAYSFDTDDRGAEESYKKMHDAYCRIFQRLGLAFRAVEADSGPIGGSYSHEFMVLAETGEDVIISCTSCDYAANIEKAEIRKPDVSAPDERDFKTLQKVSTPEKKSVEEVTSFMGVEPSKLIKTLVFTGSHGPLIALVRGDHDINEVKLKHAAGCEYIELADETVIEEITHAPRGFAGPVGIGGVTVIADHGLQGVCNFVTGANECDAHLKNVNFGRDFTVHSFADIRSAQAGDRCVHCGGELAETRGIEVGHIFKLGTKYSEAMQATYLDDSGEAHSIVMGCYGIGVGRTVAAAIEQSHDSDGIIFPAEIAPFFVIIILINPTDAGQAHIADAIYDELIREGIDVLYDDRDERPGSKFKDADLIGIPVRITVGKNAVQNDAVDMKDRKTGEVKQIPVAKVLETIRGLSGYSSPE